MEYIQVITGGRRLLNPRQAPLQAGVPLSLPDIIMPCDGVLQGRGFNNEILPAQKEQVELMDVHFNNVPVERIESGR